MLKKTVLKKTMLRSRAFRWGSLLALAFLVTVGSVSLLTLGNQEEAPAPAVVKISSVVALGRIEPEGEVIRLSVPNAADSRVNEIRVSEDSWIYHVFGAVSGLDRDDADSFGDEECGGYSGICADAGDVQFIGCDRYAPSPVC